MKPRTVHVPVAYDLPALTILREVVHVAEANRLLAQGWSLVAVVPQHQHRGSDRIVYVLGQWHQAVGPR